MKKFALFVLLTLAISSCTYVDQRSAAFKVEKTGTARGVVTTILYPGYHLYNPFVESIEQVPTTMHHIVWSDDPKEGDAEDQSIQISCLGGAGFSVNVGMNLNFIPSEVPRIWLKYHTLDIDVISKTYLRNSVRGSMQLISSTMTVDSVLNNFTQLEVKCHDVIRDSLVHYGMYMDGFNILSKPKALDSNLEHAISRKIIAKQDAETEVQNVQKHNALALQKMADARGDSASFVIEQAGKAQGIKLLQAVMTPEYVQYVKWKDCDPSTPRVPQYVGAGGWVMKGGTE